MTEKELNESVEQNENVEQKEEVKVEETITDETTIVEETAKVEEPVKDKKPVKVEVKAEKKEVKSVVEFATPSDDFDWDNISNERINTQTKEREEFEKMYNETLSTITENEVIDGSVVSMNKREVVINIGYKSEGVVSLNEFRYNAELKAGDSVEVYVESQEDKDGQLVLSHKKARALRSWDRVNEALEKDEIIKGFIKCRTKGGMIVDVFGIEAFLPGSQIDVKPIRDYDIYVEKTMEFKVVKINHEFKNVVVSHKALIEAELEIQKKEIIAKLEKGQVLEGTVKNITSYGVFIDLGGVDGLIHITDLSWGRVNHPEEIVQLDQKLNVVILDFDDDKKRIALGLKQLTPHPWDSLDKKLKVTDNVKGRVVVLADYGAFVEIQPGVEGLIHVSEMSWSQHLRSAQEFLQVNDEVEAQILTLDREERKMSLGMKQLKTDPWSDVDDKYAVGTKHSATIRNFTNFGVFVEIEEGVDGLIHISDLSWTKKIKHPAEFTSIGESIDVVVLEIDKDNRRLSLGHKQLEENPWDVFETVFTAGSIHEGTVVDVFDKGAVIALPYGVEGFVTPKHFVKEDGTSAKVDEKLDFKVIEFSKTSKKIILSHSRVFEDEKKGEEIAERKQKTATKNKAVKKIKSNLEKTTLGDISELASLKNEMEQEQKKEIAEKKAEMDAKEEAKIVEPKKPASSAGEEETKVTKPKAKPKAKKTEEKTEDKVEEKKEEKEEKEEKKAVKKATKPKAEKKTEKKDEEKASE
ncbi:MAG: 30S ribosomal protein S1 [Bacteroidales bacterium]|jgi:small subunit ribosomal protein S1|nr:30S ribosomal protein S1 [Bacteroidales bacterium]